MLALDTGLAAVAVALVEALVGGRKRFWTRLGLQLVCLVVLTVSVVKLLGSPFAPVFAMSGAEGALERVLATAWWAIAARLAVLAARFLVTHEARPRESRIVSDLLGGVISVVAALAVVALVFGVPVRGLLATSGVIAIVLGLALQSTLSDLFSGIAVGVERPYRTGDMLAIDGGIAGRVVQVNWRSTHIQVGYDVAVVPNSLVAKSRLVNRSAPTLSTGDSVEVRVHPAVPVRRVLPVLRAALDGCEELAAGTASGVSCTALGGDGSVFTLSFVASSTDRVGAARSEVLEQVHRHLFHAGIPLGIAGMATETGWTARPPEAIELLARSDLFAGMAEPHHTVLAEHLKPVELQEGEVLFRTGDAPDSLFLIAGGTIEILVGDPAAPVRRRRLSPGETLGLVALVGGQPYRATASALNAARAFQLDRAGLMAALAAEPGLEADLERAVSRALAIMARLASGDATTEQSQPMALLGRLRSFLRGLR